MLETRDAAQSPARGRRDAHRVAPSVVQPVKNGFVLRLVVITMATWIVTWSCIGAALYVQEPPPPYVLDREDD